MTWSNHREHGLEDSLKLWYGLDFKQSQGDHTLFIKHSKIGEVTLLLVYVDDIIVTSDEDDQEFGVGVLWLGVRNLGSHVSLSNIFSYRCFQDPYYYFVHQNHLE